MNYNTQTPMFDDQYTVNSGYDQAFVDEFETSISTLKGEQEPYSPIRPHSPSETEQVEEVKAFPFQVVEDPNSDAFKKRINRIRDAHYFKTGDDSEAVVIAEKMWWDQKQARDRYNNASKLVAQGYRPEDVDTWVQGGGKLTKPEDKRQILDLDTEIEGVAYKGKYLVDENYKPIRQLMKPEQESQYEKTWLDPNSGAYLGVKKGATTATLISPGGKTDKPQDTYQKTFSTPDGKQWGILNVDRDDKKRGDVIELAEGARLQKESAAVAKAKLEQGERALANNQKLLDIQTQRDKVRALRTGDGYVKAIAGGIDQYYGVKDDKGNEMYPMRDWSLYYPESAPEAISLLEEIQSGMFLENIKSMKGFGSLSNAEGAKVQSAMGALQSARSSEKTFKKKLKGLETAYDNLLKVAEFEQGLQGEMPTPEDLKRLNSSLVSPLGGSGSSDPLGIR